MTIPHGSSHWSRDDAYRGVIPKKIVVRFVDSRAVAGHFKHNPYEIEHLNVAQIVKYANAEPVPSKPLLVAPAPGSFRDGYLSLLEATRILFKNGSQSFQSFDWPLEYSLLVSIWNLMLATAPA